MSGSNCGREYYRNKILRLAASSKVKDLTVTIEKKVPGAVSKSPISYDLGEPFKLVVHLKKDAVNLPVFDKPDIAVNTCSDPSHTVVKQLGDDSVEYRRFVSIAKSSRSKSQSPVAKPSQLPTGKRFRSQSKDSCSNSSAVSLYYRGYSRSSSPDENYGESKFEGSRTSDRGSFTKTVSKARSSSSPSYRSKSRSISSERYKASTSKARKSRSPHRGKYSARPSFSSEGDIGEGRRSRSPPLDRIISRSVSGITSTRIPVEKRRRSHSPSNGGPSRPHRLPLSRRKGEYTRADYERDQREKEIVKRKLEDSRERSRRQSEKDERNKSPKRSDEEYERRGRYEERKGRSKSPRRSGDDYRRRRSCERGNRSPKRRPDEEYTRQAYSGATSPYYYYGQPDEYWPMMPAPMRPPFLAPYHPPTIYPQHRVLPPPIMQPRMPGMHFSMPTPFRTPRQRHVHPRNLHTIPRMQIAETVAKMSTPAAASNSTTSTISITVPKIEKASTPTATTSESAPIASTSSAPITLSAEIVPKNVDVDNK